MPSLKHGGTALFLQDYLTRAAKIEAASLDEEMEKIGFYSPAFTEFLKLLSNETLELAYDIQASMNKSDRTNRSSLESKEQAILAHSEMLLKKLDLFFAEKFPNDMDVLLEKYANRSITGLYAENHKKQGKTVSEPKLETNPTLKEVANNLREELRKADLHNATVDDPKDKKPYTLLNYSIAYPDIKLEDLVDYANAANLQCRQKLQGYYDSYKDYLSPITIEEALQEAEDKKLKFIVGKNEKGEDIKRVPSKEEIMEVFSFLESLGPKPEPGQHNHNICSANYTLAIRILVKTGELPGRQNQTKEIINEMREQKKPTPPAAPEPKALTPKVTKPRVKKPQPQEHTAAIVDFWLNIIQTTDAKLPPKQAKLFKSIFSDLINKQLKEKRFLQISVPAINPEDILQVAMKQCDINPESVQKAHGTTMQAMINKEGHIDVSVYDSINKKRYTPVQNRAIGKNAAR